MDGLLGLPPVSPFIAGMRARSPSASPLFSFFFSPSVACSFWPSLSKNNFMMDFLLFPFIQTHQDKISGSREEPHNSETKIWLHSSLSLRKVRGQRRQGKGREKPSTGLSLRRMICARGRPPKPGGGISD